jgi:hypothetical protein
MRRRHPGDGLTAAFAILPRRQLPPGAAGLDGGNMNAFQ